MLFYLLFNPWITWLGTSGSISCLALSGRQGKPGSGASFMCNPPPKEQTGYARHTYRWHLFDGSASYGRTPSEQICFGVLRRKGTRFSSPGHGHRILIDEVKGVGESATIMLDLRKAPMVGGGTDSL
jgi:hypothetical protein